MPPQPVKRKIYFYRANVGMDQGGRPFVNGGEIMYRRGGVKLSHGLGGSLSP